MKTKYIKIGDIAIIILAILSIIFYIRYRESVKSEILIIETPNTKYRYKTHDDRTIIIDGIIGESVIEIKDSTVHFLNSNCRDKICIKAGDLKYSPIVCLPNGISIYYEKLETDDGEAIDSFAQ